MLLRVPDDYPLTEFTRALEQGGFRIDAERQPDGSHWLVRRKEADRTETARRCCAADTEA